MFFGVIVISDGRFLFIFKQADVLVADVDQPLVSVFRNALVFACAVLVFAYVSCVFSHSRPSKVRGVIVKRIPINVIHTSFVLWVWAPFFSNQAMDEIIFTA